MLEIYTFVINGVNLAETRLSSINYFKNFCLYIMLNFASQLTNLKLSMVINLVKPIKIDFLCLKILSP